MWLRFFDKLYLRVRFFDFFILVVLMAFGVSGACAVSAEVAFGRMEKEKDVSKIRQGGVCNWKNVRERILQPESYKSKP